jgi:hypothetical protein
VGDDAGHPYWYERRLAKNLKLSFEVDE